MKKKNECSNAALYVCTFAISTIKQRTNKMRTEQNSSTKYAELLRTTQWLERRKLILQRDKYRCCNCGSSYGLEVHHRQYQLTKKTGVFLKPWKYEDINLVTLCSRCHQIGHKKFKIPVFNV